MITGQEVKWFEEVDVFGGPRGIVTDGETDYFDIVAGVLQEDTLSRYLFIIFVDYMLRTSIDIMKDNGFKWQRKEEKDTPHKQLRMWTTLIT